MGCVFPFPQALFHGGAPTLEVVISTNQVDLDLWTYVNTNYASASDYEVFNVTINSGVIISCDSDTPSFRIGSASWPAGSTINISNSGTIAGKGGDGGYNGNGDDGGDGNSAIDCARACTITNNSGGEVSGGGGGGGGAGYQYYTGPYPVYGSYYVEGGGGGGAGRDGGTGGYGVNNPYSGGEGNSGADGTATAGGAGGDCYVEYQTYAWYYSGDGGIRGGTGQAGDAGAAGPAGKAVAFNGNSVSWTNNGTLFGLAS